MRTAEVPSGTVAPRTQPLVPLLARATVCEEEVLFPPTTVSRWRESTTPSAVAMSSSATVSATGTLRVIRVAARAAGA